MATQNAAPEETPGPALSEEELVSAAPEVLAESLGDYLHAQWRKIKGGESGALPVLVGLIAIVIFFQAENSNFLKSQNLVNLLVEASLFVMYGAAETFALLLSEIDLSIGYGSILGAFVMAEMIAPPISLPWWLGILAGLAAMAIIGLVQALLITRLSLPSFIVTLGGYLGLQGVIIQVANADSTAVGGVINVDPSNPVAKLAEGHLSTTLGWVLMVVAVGLFAAASIWQNLSRRRRNLTAPPLSVTLVTVAAAAVGGIVLVLICNSNQSLGVTPIRGMPAVIPFTFVVLLACSWILARTRMGRYLYAVGNNPEAARRAGINVRRIYVFGFVMSSVIAGFAGLIYLSSQGSVSTGAAGGQYVLYAVAAAVIGGTSLFGGRGKVMNALLGGIVVGAVINGLGIMGAGPDVTLEVTAVVLIAAVTLDALVRRRVTLR